MVIVADASLQIGPKRLVHTDFTTVTEYNSVENGLRTYIFIIGFGPVRQRSKTAFLGAKTRLQAS